MRIPEDLRAGDILLYSPSDLVGLLIAIKTGGWFSHVECCIGGDQVIAARLQGVNAYATRLDSHLCAVRRPLVSFDAAGAGRAVAPLMGKSYEVEGFCDFFLPLAHSRQVHRICSVVATAWLRGGGVQPFNPLFDCDHVSPVDLWETPALNTVWRK